MNLDLKYKVAKFDAKTGRRTLGSMGWRKSESFLANFINILWEMRVTAASSIVCKDLDGVNKAVSDYLSNFDVTALVGEYIGGIIVGTGVGAVTLQDYNLTVIAHGGGAGQLDYGAQLVATPAFSHPVYSGSSGYFRFWRTFVNDSGGTIVVGEIGVVGLGRVVTTATPFLVIRDVPSPSVSLNDGQGMTVTYQVGITV